MFDERWLRVFDELGKLIVKWASLEILIWKFQNTNLNNQLSINLRVYFTSEERKQDTLNTP